MNFGRIRSQCTTTLKEKGCRDTGLCKGSWPACSLSTCLLKSPAPYLEVHVPGILFLEKEGQSEENNEDHLISLLNKANI